ncbi:mitochondrial ribosomal protein L23 [Daedalea quercina L-15889]|uniref:Large ribosomal subunit protein uL23m n=1 Tax=Daedalea quercina L-15889 TaxID=1314783 RepID=A0A165LLJ5_9APHY|nr:mitochondrial ribosomal protein L23 [Daedalea quercina L-15889]
MQHCFRRLYATIPDAAAVARTTSTPRSVRLRRLRIKRTKHPKLPVESDATLEGLTPTELAHYNRASAKGELLQDNGENLTASEWLERLNAQRSRVRGVRQKVNEAGEVEEQVVGQKIYLPNIIIKFVRNHTPPGQPYNPYEATFRIPPSMTKTDLRSYLSAVYGVKTTYIRTDNYLSPVTRDPQTRAMTRTVPHKTFKRAVVGLVEPFYYPLAMEDMSAEEREQREDWLEENFRITQFQLTRRAELLRLYQGSPKKPGVPTRRGDILQHIAERRAEREHAIAQAKEEMRGSRKVAQTHETRSDGKIEEVTV